MVWNGDWGSWSSMYRPTDPDYLDYFACGAAVRAEERQDDKFYESADDTAANGLKI